MLKKLVGLVRQYPQCWTCLYFFIYMPWFFLLERRGTENVVWLNTTLDDKIPFCEYFIIPYYLWFLLVPAVVVFILFKRRREEFYRLSAMLFVGMSICLLICTFFPNGVQLRGFLNSRANVFTWLVSLIYHSDTNTNVFPSIHVYASLCCYIAINRTRGAHRVRWLMPALFVLVASITMSTVFLKQHCLLDVFGAMVLAELLKAVIYRPRGLTSADRLMTDAAEDN